MSFTTRQLGANRVNRMPGAPVSCNVTNYTLKEFDGVIKGTDATQTTQNLRCTDQGILKVDIVNQEDDAATLSVDNATLDEALADGSPPAGETLETKKFLAIGGRIFNDGDSDGDLDTPTNTFKELQVDANGVLSVNVSGGIAFNGAVTDNNLKQALHNYDGPITKGTTTGSDKLLIVGAKQDGTPADKYNALNLDVNENLKVVETNISSALGTTDNTGLAKSPDVSKFLAIGGRIFNDGDSSDDDDVLDTQTDNFKELQVDTNGVLSVNVTGGGGCAVTNDGLDSLNNASKNTQRKNNDDQLEDCSNKQYLVIGGRIDDGELNEGVQKTTTFKELKVDASGVLSVTNNGLASLDNASLSTTSAAADPTTPAQASKFLAIGGRVYDSTNTSPETNTFKELQVDEDGKLQVNTSLTSEALDNLVKSTVKHGDLNSDVLTDNNTRYTKISAAYKTDQPGNNVIPKAIQCDSEGILFVKTKDTIGVSTALDECKTTKQNKIDSPEDNNTPYIRVKHVDDLGEGVVMRAVDVVGGGGASLSAIQGDISNQELANKLKTKPRLITVDVGPDVQYFTDESTPNMQNLSGSAGWVNNTATSERGLPYPIINLPIRIISKANNRPRINKIRISFRIQNSTEISTDKNSKLLYIYGGLESKQGSDVTQDANLQIFPIEYVTFGDIIKTHIQNGDDHHYFHSFVIDMPMGPEIGFFSTLSLELVFVSVAIVQF